MTEEGGRQPYAFGGEALVSVSPAVGAWPPPQSTGGVATGKLPPSPDREEFGRVGEEGDLPEDRPCGLRGVAREMRPVSP